MEFIIITNESGIKAGTYEADDEAGALNAYAQDAGYRDFTDMLDRVPGSSRDDLTIQHGERSAWRPYSLQEWLAGMLERCLTNGELAALPKTVGTPLYGRPDLATDDGKRTLTVPERAAFATVLAAIGLARVLKEGPADLETCQAVLEGMLEREPTHEESAAFLKAWGEGEVMPEPEGNVH